MEALVSTVKAKRVIIFGHSHVWALRAAWKTGSFTPNTDHFSLEIPLCGTKQFPGDLINYNARGAEQINAALLSVLNTHPPAGANDVYLASVCQGNAYNAVGLLLEGPAFDFVVPGYEALPLNDGADLVPFGAIKSLIQRQCIGLTALMHRLSKLGYAGIMHFEAPPPIEDGDFVAEKLRQNNEINNSTAIVNDKYVRLKLWLTQTLIMQEICDAAGVRYVREVPATSNEAGFLADEYKKDAVHANFLYGVELLSCCERIVQDWNH
jgi:hypothetical protein